MNTDEMQDMAELCLEGMRAMGAMMDMPGGTEGGSAMGGMGSMMDMGAMGWMMGIGGLLALLVLLLVVVGGSLLLAVVWTRRRARTDAVDTGGPLHELDRRYARGEVDRDSYLQIRSDLREAGGQG